jgi:membrane protease YdiL (CAAX protease family)
MHTDNTNDIRTGSHERARIKRSIITFVVLAFALSTVGYVATVASGEASVLLLVAPALAALITRYLFQRNVRGFAWQLPKPRAAVSAYLLPFLVSGSVFIAAWLVFGYYTTDNTDTAVLQGLVISATVGFLAAAAFGFGEELGWRGFLVPELAKITGFTNVALISGVIWALWHWPLILFAADVTDFDKAPAWFTLPAFSITIVAAGTVLAWLTLRTRSIWPAVIMHGSQNAITQGFFAEYTSQQGNSAYYVSEVGALIAIAWVIAAYVFWRHRNSLPNQPTHTPENTLGITVTASRPLAPHQHPPQTPPVATPRTTHMVRPR